MIRKILLLLILTTVAYGVYSVLPCEKDNFEIPKYLLIIRYKGFVSQQYGDTVTSCWGWNYLTETYQTIDQVLNRLNTCGGSPLENEEQFVGLWELKDNIKSTLKLAKTETIIPKHIEEEKEVKYKWEIKQGDEE